MATRKHTTPIQYFLPLLFPEEWRPVVDFEDIYQVSDQGRVRSFDRVVRLRHAGGTKRIKGKILKPGLDRKLWYPRVYLYRDDIVTQKYVHGLVLEAFVGPRPDGYSCNHKDGNKANNALINLEWITFQENTQHAIQTGLMRPYGEESVVSVLTNTQVLEIRCLYKHGMSQRALGRQFDVAHTTIGRIVRRQRWNHLRDEGERT